MAQRLPMWLSLAVQDQVVTREQAQELAALERTAPPGEYVDVPDHLRQATVDLWLWEVPPVNVLPV